MFADELNRLDNYYKVDNKPFNQITSKRLIYGAKQMFQDETVVAATYNRKKYRTSPQMNVFKRQKVEK